MRHGVKKSSVRLNLRNSFVSHVRTACRQSLGVGLQATAAVSKNLPAPHFLRGPTSGGNRMPQELDEDGIELFNAFLMHEVPAG